MCCTSRLILIGGGRRFLILTPDLLTNAGSEDDVSMSSGDGLSLSRRLPAIIDPCLDVKNTPSSSCVITLSRALSQLTLRPISDPPFLSSPIFFIDSSTIWKSDCITINVPVRPTPALIIKREKWAYKKQTYKKKKKITRLTSKDTCNVLIQVHPWISYMLYTYDLLPVRLVPAHRVTLVHHDLAMKGNGIVALPSKRHPNKRG